MSSGSTTRTVHVVRCTDASSGQYFDVQISDEIGWTRKNNRQDLLRAPAANCVPYIVDNTGDGNGTSYDPKSSTRATHMLRINDAGGPCYDAEVLDALGSTLNNNKQQADVWRVAGVPDNSVVYLYNPFGYSYSIPDGVTWTVTDDPTQATRAGTLYLVNAQGIMDVNPNNPSPGDGNYLTVMALQATGFTENNHAQSADSINPYPGDLQAFQSAGNEPLVGFLGETIVDTTVYDANGNPPPNGDPDPYIGWLAGGGSKVFSGDAIVSQGPLWQIIGVGPAPPSPSHVHLEPILVMITAWCVVINQDDDLSNVVTTVTAGEGCEIVDSAIWKIYFPQSGADTYQAYGAPNFNLLGTAYGTGDSEAAAQAAAIATVNTETGGDYGAGDFDWTYSGPGVTNASCAFFGVWIVSVPDDVVVHPPDVIATLNSTYCPPGGDGSSQWTYNALWSRGAPLPHAPLLANGYAPSYLDITLPTVEHGLTYAFCGISFGDGDYPGGLYPVDLTVTSINPNPVTISGAPPVPRGYPTISTHAPWTPTGWDFVLQS